MEQKRVFSPVMWATLVALIAFVLGEWGLYDYIGLTSETFQQLCNLVLAVLVAFGIINNPTNKTGL